MLYFHPPSVNNFLCTDGIHDPLCALNGHRDSIQTVVDYNVNHDIVLLKYYHLVVLAMVASTDLK